MAKMIITRQTAKPGPSPSKTPQWFGRGDLLLSNLGGVLDVGLSSINVLYTHRGHKVTFWLEIGDWRLVNIESPVSLKMSVYDRWQYNTAAAAIEL